MSRVRGNYRSERREGRDDTGTGLDGIPVPERSRGFTRQYIVSSTLTDQSLIDGWGPLEILRSIEDVVVIKQGDGGAVFIHGSTELTRGLPEDGLIDR